MSARDVDSIYKVPLEFEQEGVADRVLDHFRMGTAPPDLSDWKGLVDRIGSASTPVRIALVGKYNQLADAYLSVIEALNHAGTHHGGRVEVHWVDSERLTDGEVEAELATCDGILVPGGFGVRGIEGKIKAARFAREQGVPYLGNLPRDADRRLRVRPARGGHGRRELDRVRPRDPVPRDRPPARSRRRSGTWAGRCGWAPTP